MCKLNKTKVRTFVSRLTQRIAVERQKAVFAPTAVVRKVANKTFMIQSRLSQKFQLTSFCGSSFALFPIKVSKFILFGLKRILLNK